MENNKLDCSSVCTAILGYGRAVEIFDRKYQSRLRFSIYSNIRLGDCGRDTCWEITNRTAVQYVQQYLVMGLQ